jgi:NTE family protein
MTQKKIGLALSGGRARGFAHIGAVKALVDNDIPIDVISGTSAGSFVGGALASGLSVDEIIEVGRKISWFGVAGFLLLAARVVVERTDGKVYQRQFSRRAV